MIMKYDRYALQDVKLVDFKQIIVQQLSTKNVSSFRYSCPAIQLMFAVFNPLHVARQQADIVHTYIFNSFLRINVFNNVMQHFLELWKYLFQIMEGIQGSFHLLQSNATIVSKHQATTASNQRSLQLYIHVSRT